MFRYPAILIEAHPAVRGRITYAWKWRSCIGPHPPSAPLGAIYFVSRLTTLKTLLIPRQVAKTISKQRPISRFYIHIQIMTYRMEPIQPADFDTLVPPMFDAFGTHYEFVNALYPNHDTPSGRKAIAAKFRLMHKAATNTYWIKAVVTASGKAAGLAMWTSIEREENKPPEKDLDGPPGTWPSEEMKEYCRAMHRDVVAGRRRLILVEEVPIVGKWHFRKRV
jgi:hypothetical protein